MRNKKYILLVLMLLVISVSYAQPGFDDDIEDTAPIPGLVVAVVAAIGLGAAKLIKKK